MRAEFRAKFEFHQNKCPRGSPNVCPLNDLSVNSRTVLALMARIVLSSFLRSLFVRRLSTMKTGAMTAPMRRVRETMPGQKARISMMCHVMEERMPMMSMGI